MASSAGSVSFSFIHTKDMPVFACFFAGSCRFTLPIFGAFSGFPFAAKCFKRRTEFERPLTINNRLFSMRIAMIGTGYVGLVSGACFADFGHQVTCVDKDGDKIAALKRGEIPIFEPGLDALVAANVKAKRLDFTTDLTAPVAEADAVFIAVGTPSRRASLPRLSWVSRWW
jgi:lactate dehydrogenase-like 2-hydroxyacid dehydrogenase